MPSSKKIGKLALNNNKSTQSAQEATKTDAQQSTTTAPPLAPPKSVLILKRKPQNTANSTRTNNAPQPEVREAPKRTHSERAASADSSLDSIDSISTPSPISDSPKRPLKKMKQAVANMQKPTLDPHVARLKSDKEGEITPNTLHKFSNLFSSKKKAAPAQWNSEFLMKKQQERIEKSVVPKPAQNVGHSLITQDSPRNQARSVQAHAVTSKQVPTVSTHSGLAQGFSCIDSFSVSSTASDEQFHQQSIESTYCFNYLQGYKRLKVKTKPEIRNLKPEIGRAKVFIATSSQCSRAKAQTTEADYTVILKGEWLETDVVPGDIIHLVNHSSGPENNILTVDNSKGLLVLNPDYLVNTTRVGDAAKCQRIAYFQEKRMTDSSVSNAAAINGTIVHSLFEKAVKEKEFSRTGLLKHFEKLTEENIVALRASGQNEGAVKEIIQEFLTTIEVFFKQGVGPKAPGVNVKHFDKEHDAMVRFTEVLDVEESMWSPTYGLKGIADLTVKFERVDTKVEMTGPLELKSGKRWEARGNMTHRAQVLLYMLLLSEKYQTPINNAILFYLGSNDLSGVQRADNELRSLIIHRNKVVSMTTNGRMLTLDSEQEMEPSSDSSQQFSQITEIAQLFPKPPPLENHASSFDCNRCFHKEVCMIYHKAIEDGVYFNRKGVPRDLENLYQGITGNLTEAGIIFIRKWFYLLELESTKQKQFRAEMWTLTGPEREQYGRCLSCMVIKQQIYNPESDRHTCILEKHENASQRNLLKREFQVGDRVILGTEIGHVGVAAGIIVKLDPTEIHIEVPKEVKTPSVSAFLWRKVIKGTMLWRIDKEEFFATSSRASLFALFRSNSHEKLRQLVVEKAAPKFSKSALPPLSSQWYASLNNDQKGAILKLHQAEDYMLITGMPGTGKTTAIVNMIKFLTQSGKKVLLSGYTHAAVDNVLLKLLKEQIGFVRIGKPAHVHRDVAPFTVDSILASSRTTTSLEKIVNDAKLVACTCLVAFDPILSGTRFDYCIVDEASQVTVPIVIAPLMLSEKFVLVGDPKQLPPLVESAKAKAIGMDISLFSELAIAHPHAEIKLSMQYRMNKHVLKLSNKVVYDGTLISAPEVENQLLKLPYFRPFNEVLPPFDSFKLHNWLTHAVNPSNPVVFLNTDTVPAPHNQSGKKANNPVEIQLVNQVTLALLQCGLSARQLGIISPYNTQVTLLKNELATKSLSDVMVHTIDRFQGSDRECIIISLVLSGDKTTIAEFMTDWRRLNVAFTRAKQKLIIIGSLKTHADAMVLSEYIEIMQQENWVYNLPEKAHELVNIRSTIMDARIYHNSGDKSHSSSSSSSSCDSNFSSLSSSSPVLLDAPPSTPPLTPPQPSCSPPKLSSFRSVARTSTPSEEEQHDLSNIWNITSPAFGLTPTPSYTIPSLAMHVEEPPLPQKQSKPKLADIEDLAPTTKPKPTIKFYIPPEDDKPSPTSAILSQVDTPFFKTRNPFFIAKFNRTEIERQRRRELQQAFAMDLGISEEKVIKLARKLAEKQP